MTEKEKNTIWFIGGIGLILLLIWLFSRPEGTTLEGTTPTYSAPTYSAPTVYKVLKLDLSTARYDEEILLEASSMCIPPSDGVAIIKINDRSSEGLSTQTLRNVKADIQKIYISNTAQAGKTLEIIYSTGVLEFGFTETQNVVTDIYSNYEVYNLIPDTTENTQDFSDTASLVEIYNTGDPVDIAFKIGNEYGDYLTLPAESFYTIPIQSNSIKYILSEGSVTSLLQVRVWFV